MLSKHPYVVDCIPIRQDLDKKVAGCLDQICPTSCCYETVQTNSWLYFDL